MAMKQVALLFFILISCSASSASSDFISIDCGASDSYIDENGISWDTDESYISNGESRTIQSSNSVSKPMQTLRVFSTRNKNCYPIAIDTDSRILVRASFYYGNYDKKSTPPTFALMFDANEWATVKTSMNETVIYEAIYDVIGGTAICVAQTNPGQLPFISAIEVRHLEDTMYDDYNSSFALFTRRRIAFGSPDMISYPSDDYDRIWSAFGTAPDGITLLKSDTDVMDVSTAANYPPKDVLLNAISVTDSSNDLILPMTTALPTVPVPVLIMLYFTEMTELSSNDNRSFAISVDEQVVVDSVSPPYQSALSYYIKGDAVSANSTIYLHALSYSTLPPIISAIEVFTASELSSGTDPSDLDSLIALQQEFGALNDWSGDPCLPINIELVNCSTDTVPRVTALYLSGLGLAGKLPDLSNMTALEIIDFSNNNLTGKILESYASLPNLKELNLSYNKLSGPIPSSLANNKNIKLETTGNPNLCNAGQSCSTDPEVTSSPSSLDPKRIKSSSTPKVQYLNNIGICVIILFSIFAVIF